jgi:formylglycine-generating enzyme required for sulfatase activity/Ethanolamine utilization protein EutJ (predicted chaperonin)
VKLGIDFGTCYSSAALFIDGKLSPVREPSRPSEYCFPSSICVTKKGEIVISQAAENKRLLNPQGYKNEFKRDLETGIPYALGEKSLFPEDLVAIMIQGLKKEAEKIVNTSLNSVVITIPATYLSSKKQLMKTAAKKAGFTEVTLLAEPVAAAIYYAEKGSLGHQLNEGDIVLVYDLGGGTFDAALIQKKGHSYELLGQPEGDKQCGGIDFDRLIGQDLKRQLNGDPALELLANKRTDNDALRAKLNFQDWCRNFKHQLSVEEEYEDLSPVGSDSYSLSREQFESMIAEYIDKSCNLCQNLVNKAGIEWEKVNRILLVGGSCRIPYVKKRLEQQFKRQVVAIDDPELAICFGAAIYGVNLVKTQEAEQKRREQEEIERQRLEQKQREQKEQECQRLERDKIEAELRRNEQEIALHQQRVHQQLKEKKRQQEQENRRRLEEEKQQKIAEVENLQGKLFSFETVRVNNRGEIVTREQKQARCVTENLPQGAILERVFIPGGTFMMGSPVGEGEDREKPQHQVTLPTFFISKYPITQAQWGAVASLPQEQRQLNSDPSAFKGNNRPVENVTWYDAVEFCARLSRFTGQEYRLPSEAEWEYACRAGTTTPFYFGETITPKLANYDGNHTYGYALKGEYRRETTNVGIYPPNAFGLYDMHGNVWEWCADTWHDNYAGAPTDGSAWIANRNNNCSRLLGGSWYNDPNYCRSAYRFNNYHGRDCSDYYIGFRVACFVQRT